MPELVCKDQQPRHVHGNMGQTSSLPGCIDPEGSSGVQSVLNKGGCREEVDLQRNLLHPNIVRFLGASADVPSLGGSATLAIVMELCRLGALQGLIRDAHRWAYSVIKQPPLPPPPARPGTWLKPCVRARCSESRLIMHDPGWMHQPQAAPWQPRARALDPASTVCSAITLDSLSAVTTQHSVSNTVTLHDAAPFPVHSRRD